jgi:hypothetical protein
MSIETHVKKAHGETPHLQAFAAKAMKRYALGGGEFRNKAVNSCVLDICKNGGEISKGTGAHLVNRVSHGLLALPSEFFHSFPARGRKQE